MNVPDLIARVGEWLAVVELDADGRVVVRECRDCHVPLELLDECREHKAALGGWLRWEQAAAVLWRSVFRRMFSRADLAGNPDFQALLAVADAAHLRHDRAALVDALLDLEDRAREVTP
ncbi:MAG: hypothetical protein ACYC33_10460 [Thermoleophilia bacterium]